MGSSQWETEEKEEEDGIGSRGESKEEEQVKVTRLASLLSIEISQLFSLSVWFPLSPLAHVYLIVETGKSRAETWGVRRIVSTEVCPRNSELLRKFGIRMFVRSSRAMVDSVPSTRSLCSAA